MEGEIPDSDPLTFEEGFECNIHSQDEIDDYSKEEASRGVGVGKKNRKSRHYLLNYCTAEEFMKKHPGCFSMNYPGDIFEGIEHSVHFHQISSQKQVAKDASKSSPTLLKELDVNQRVTEYGVNDVPCSQISPRKEVAEDALKSIPLPSTGVNVNQRMTLKDGSPDVLKPSLVSSAGVKLNQDVMLEKCYYLSKHTDPPHDAPCSPEGKEKDVKCQYGGRTPKAPRERLVCDTVHDKIWKQRKTSVCDEIDCSSLVHHNSSLDINSVSLNEGSYDSTNSNDSWDLHMEENINLFPQCNSPGAKGESVSPASFTEQTPASLDSDSCQDVHMKENNLNVSNTESAFESEIKVEDIPLPKDNNGGGGGKSTSVTSWEDVYRDKVSKDLLNRVFKKRKTPRKSKGHDFQHPVDSIGTKRPPQSHPLPRSRSGRPALLPTPSYPMAAPSRPIQRLPKLHSSATSTTTSAASANPAPSVRPSISPQASSKVHSSVTPTQPPSTFSSRSSATPTPSPPPAFASLYSSATSTLTPALANLRPAATPSPSPPPLPPQASPKPDSNWHDTWMRDSAKEGKDSTVLPSPNNSGTKISDSTVSASGESEYVIWRQQGHNNMNARNPSPFAGHKRHIDKNINVSWKKTARRSLDWPPTTHTTSEGDDGDCPSVNDLPRQAKEVKTARRSLDWLSATHTISEAGDIGGSGSVSALGKALARHAKGKTTWRSLDWPSGKHTASETGDIGASSGDGKGKMTWQSKEVKATRRSLDWLFTTHNTSETGDKGFTRQAKEGDDGRLSWRKGPRSSLDWPLSLHSARSFHSRRKTEAEFDVKALQKTSFSPGFIDTHCHLDFLYERTRHSGTYSKFRKTTDDPFPVSYEGCVTIFCKPWTFEKMSWWEDIVSERQVWAAYGCHPHFADKFGDKEEAYLQIALAHSKTVALGEIGLDYFKKNPDHFGVQKEVLRRQLRVAVRRKKPVIIHCRDAHRDCVDIIKEILPLDYKIHLHCFTGTWQQAEEWLDTFSNLFIGITNLINNGRDMRTYNLQKAVKNIPLHRLLLETDAPYFRPAFLEEPGQYAHPGMALYVAAQVAHLKGEEVQMVLTHVRHNTMAMYGI